MALVAKMCDMIDCEKPLGHVTAGGLLLSGKHRKGKDGIDSAPLTPEDLETLAKIIRLMRAKSDRMGGEVKERAA